MLYNYKIALRSLLSIFQYKFCYHTWFFAFFAFIPQQTHTKTLWPFLTFSALIWCFWPIWAISSSLYHPLKHQIQVWIFLGPFWIIITILSSKPSSFDKNVEVFSIWNRNSDFHCFHHLFMLFSLLNLHTDRHLSSS